ncbi:MAG: sporulation protein [Bacillota bacterium]|uniref:sporulation protein n=1 Tax=Virgibacillus TaxID=84406 RepID=UPI00041A7CBF
MRKIDHTLDYLRESLSNYINNDTCRQIVRKLERGNYANELDFVKRISEEEMTYLNDVLENEIAYAKSVQYDRRVKELTEVYEQLF